MLLHGDCWVAVEELPSSFYHEETLLFIYNPILVNHVPDNSSTDCGACTDHDGSCVFR